MWLLRAPLPQRVAQHAARRRPRAAGRSRRAARRRAPRAAPRACPGASGRPGRRARSARPRRARARARARSCGRSPAAPSERETHEARVVPRPPRAMRSKCSGAEQSSLTTQTQSLSVCARSDSTCARNSAMSGSNVAMQTAISPSGRPAEARRRLGGTTSMRPSGRRLARRRQPRRERELHAAGALARGDRHDGPEAAVALPGRALDVPVRPAWSTVAPSTSTSRAAGVRRCAKQLPYRNSAVAGARGSGRERALEGRHQVSLTGGGTYPLRSMMSRAGLPTSADIVAARCRSPPREPHPGRARAARGRTRRRRPRRCARAYLDLLKLASATWSGTSTSRSARCRRQSDARASCAARGCGCAPPGMDWPLQGLTMVGLDRLDDLQRCVESVVARRRRRVT